MAHVHRPTSQRGRGRDHCGFALLFSGPPARPPSGTVRNAFFQHVFTTSHIYLVCRTTRVLDRLIAWTLRESATLIQVTCA
jgi:hypothetical protein